MRARSRDVWALVPVKRLDRAKSRLAGVLSPAERRRLARAMLADVLDVLRAVPDLAGTLVVTADAAAAAVATRFGAVVTRDRADCGLNAAVAAGLARLAAEGRGAALIVPADLPLVTGAAVEAVIAALDRADVVLVPAAGDAGTNCMAGPPGRLVPHYGPESFARHRAAALAAGTVPVSIQPDGLATDVDRPDDLRAVLASGRPTGTRRLLETLAVRSRLDGMAEAPAT